MSRERAYSGQFSLKFTFGPDAPGKMSWAEQRFKFGEYLPAVWVEYMLYVPANFYHRLQADGSENNKFASFWRDDYGEPSDWQFAFEYTPSKGEGRRQQAAPAHE